MAEKQKMTLHRALSELKLIDSKIEKQTAQLNVIGIYQKGKLVNQTTLQADFDKDAKADMQSILDLIERKAVIKSAVVEANSTTRLTIAGKEVTIADAINFKANIKFKKALIERLKGLYNSYVATLNRNNEVVKQNVQNLLTASFGKDAATQNANAVESIQKPYMDANEFHLSDPIEADKKQKALQEEVSNFEVEVDSCLSEINSITFIEV